jgi:hypothetical protein
LTNYAAQGSGGLQSGGRKSSIVAHTLLYTDNGYAIVLEVSRPGAALASVAIAVALVALAA